MSRRALFLVCSVGLVALLAFSCIQIRRNPQICHLVHLASPPSGLLRPVVLWPDVLSADDGRQEYSFTPEYCEIYEIGLLSDHAPLPQGYDPGVRFRVEIKTAAGVRIADFERSTPARVSLASTGTGAGKVSYGTFGVAKPGEPLRLIVDVAWVEGPATDDHSGLKLFVAVSGSP